VLGMAGVVIGAFGAHGLRPHLDAHQLEMFEKGVYYHFVHTLTAMFCGLYYYQHSRVEVLRAGWLFIAGVVCFSGSLYGLATATLTGMPLAILGPITPIGGLLFIAGWGLLASAAYKSA
jgi:uncharacterized membrane protein YgdD (TMEM256/DUF423 family)